ncbi:MAG TPA: hypothetical protein VES73_02520 [Lamprocystis sp. (in: g-proteobacteria)]|nr:hypothetical protein [Lamprocystis sp. (in: g-proteobacteria)]
MGAATAYRSIGPSTGRLDTQHVAGALSSTIYNPAMCRTGVPEMTAFHQSTAVMAQERRQFRLVFGVTFMLFLGIALIARVLPRRLRPWAPVGNRHLSFVAEARAVTNTVIPFAFL